MADAIRYCDRCQVQILPTEVREGGALVRDTVAFCETCARSLSNDSLEAIKIHDTTTNYPKVTGKRKGGGSGRDRKRRPSSGRTPPPKRGSRAGTPVPRRKTTHHGMRAAKNPRRKMPVAPIVGGIGGVAIGVLTVLVVVSSSGSNKKEPSTTQLVSPTVPAIPAATMPDATATAPDPASFPDDAPSPAAERLAQIRTLIDPALLQYYDVVEALRAFPAEFPDTAEASDAEVLLLEVQVKYTKIARERAESAFKTARSDASAKRYQKAIDLLRYTATRFEGSAWYEKEGKKLFDAEVAKIEKLQPARPKPAAVEVARPIDLREGLVGWWTLDSLEDGRLLDSSTAKRHGTMAGAAKLAKGVRGKSIDLDGSDSGFSVPYHADFDIQKDLTIALWIQPDTTSHPDRLKRLILSRRDNATFHSPYEVLMDQNGEIEFTYADVDGIPWASFIFGRLKVGRWTHAAITRDDSGNIVGYIDGSPARKGKCNRVAPVPAGHNRPLHVGFSNDDLSKLQAGFRDDFMGGVDDVRIYERVLSAKEVAELARQK